MSANQEIASMLRKIIDKSDCCNQFLKTGIELPETEVLDCDGVASTVEALPTAIQGVVSVKMCGNDYEKAIRCDDTTGNQILIITQINTETGVPSTTYWDMVSGVPYTGNPWTDLVSCPDNDTESDAQEMCDGTTTFIRWFVKENWEPTGVVFDTALDGSAYTASGAEIVWACPVIVADRQADMLNSCDGTTEVVDVRGESATEVVFKENQVLKVAIDKTCDVAPTSREVDIKTDCAGTTETVAVKDEFATEVVLSPNQNIEVTIDKSCDTTRDVDMLNNCDGSTEVKAVKDEAPTEVILNENQVLKVAIDKSCDVPVLDRNIDVLEDCAGAVTSTAVSGDVAKEVILWGSTKTIDVRLKEDCTTDPVKTITTNIDCAGTTANVDTTKTVEAVINQVVDTKQCSKDESISEIEVCASGVTLVKKTKLESDGTETETFYGANGAIVTTPATYDIGVCAVPLTQVVQTQDDCAGATSNTTVNSTVAIAGSMKTLNVRIIEDCIPNFDTEYNSGCSSIDGRIILRKIVKNAETGAETITLVEQDATTLVTDGSTLVACSGADYETVDFCRYDEVNDAYYKKTVFINSSDTNDTFDVWTDSDGNTVAPVTGTVDCTTDCTTNVEFERCFETGAGNVSVQGYYTLSAGNIETYTVAKVIGSTDPAYSVWDDVLADIASWQQIDCQSPDCEITTLYRKVLPDIWVNNKGWSPLWGSVTHGPVSSIFTGFDIHPSGNPDFVWIASDYVITDIWDISPDMSWEDQFVTEAWVDFQSNAIIRDVNTSTWEYGALWIDWVKVYERFSQTVGGDVRIFDDIPVSPWIHKIWVQVSDWAAAAGVNIEVSYDNWATFSRVIPYVSKPNIECIKVSICDGIIKNVVTWEAIEFDSEIHSWCKDCCESDSPQVIYERKTTHERTTGLNTYNPPFKSFSVTSFSNDVTLNGQAIPRDFTVSIDTAENEIHVTEQIVSGTDYFVTYVI